MKAIILAAGRGSRMKKATNDQPKCLLKIKDVSLIDMQIKNFKDSGIDDISIVTGYLSHMLENRCDNIFYNRYWSKTNMVYSLMCAKEWLAESDCIVSYSDIFYDKKIINDLKDSNFDISVAYDPNWKKLWQKRFVDPLSDAETFCLSNDDFITEIGNKTSDIDDIQGQYMGIIKFKPEGWFNIEKLINELNEEDINSIQLTHLLQKCILSGIKLKAIPNLQKWGEVDSEEDLIFYNL